MINDTITNKGEILAPVGGMEQLYAAVRCGADAVYLGTKSFNARSSAENFNEAELMSAISYCRVRGVKVYIAMNTLITDKELNEVKNEIITIANAGADGVIIQDLAVAALWRQLCPDMKIHASTQMTIHNLEGVKIAEKLGFSRVVLARELTLEEIKYICQNTSLEVEVFVHGALCMSISGTCLLSSMIGARSGNRGKCAQPCRLNFKVGGREYGLSLKDLSVIDSIKKLSEAGVKSFKIEGRMKRPEYVAAAVSAVRAARDGNEFDTETLRAVFSRSGFTKGYLEGKRVLSMFGYRKKEDVVAAAPVLKDLAALYKDEKPVVPVEMTFTADENRAVLLVSDGKFTVKKETDAIEKAISKMLDYEFCEKCFGKTGGTPFYLSSLNCTISQGLSIPAKVLNSMRREALEELYSLKSEIVPYKICDDLAHEKISAAYRSDDRKLRLSFQRFDASFDHVAAEKIILPLREIMLHQESIDLYGEKLIARLPHFAFGEMEQRLEERLKKLFELGVKSVYVDNIGILALAKRLGFTVYGGYGLNVLNSLALSEYGDLGVKDCILSPEIAISDAAKISSRVSKGLLGYGFLPLMNFRACPAQGAKGCEGCRGLTEVIDRIGTRFFIMCNERHYSQLLNSVPLYIGDKEPKNIDFELLYFTFESKDTAKKIVDCYSLGAPLNTKKTGGLYFRELL